MKTAALLFSYSKGMPQYEIGGKQVILKGMAKLRNTIQNERKKYKYKFLLFDLGRQWERGAYKMCVIKKYEKMSKYRSETV